MEADLPTRLDCQHSILLRFLRVVVELDKKEEQRERETSFSGLFVCLLFQLGVSLCNSPSFAGTHFVVQAVLRLKEFLLLLPPRSWD